MINLRLIVSTNIFLIFEIGHGIFWPWNVRFIRLDDRKRALVSRLLQYGLVHEIFDIPYSEINIKRTIEGKPYLEVYSVLGNLIP